MHEEDGAEPLVESDEDWAIRVTLCLQASGLYDSETGGWVDVLAREGLNIEDPVIQQRVKAWTDSAVDHTLDAIDFTIDFPGDGEDGSPFISLTLDVSPIFAPVQWTLTEHPQHVLSGTHQADLHFRTPRGLTIRNLRSRSVPTVKSG
ncbi:hypothetical protein GCM10022198_24420 [Klugiella xanthotipulae]|uniref:Uncharacterized protein n=1 Tax=Klugiella xanthotipulae TaxID=244735 RepID=A0A543I6K1_9MICO|nr:hypothetical protein [Klugiella xanthotipulae]TQM66110.1 hypothetical protein FB466_0937 [Klugiella xanthotipulae]